ncbi:MAG: hypothetical protein KBA75_03065 [Alphaproteobacteria bacterium]|nr:hypothetical protein [Alphaproteobacteria bacterium]
MLGSMKEKMRKAREERERIRTERERAARTQQEEAARAAAMEEDREVRVRAIRIITGEVKYRYAVLDTIRTIGYAEFGGNQLIEPDQATQRAITQMQELAFSIGADAIIHAQYQVLRYTVQQRQMLYMPVYETHIFGTAIKILGPPQDWKDVDD